MIAAESWKKKIETFCRKEMNMKKRHFSPVQKKKPINSSQFSHAQRSRTTLSLSLSLSDDEMNAFQRKHFRKSKEEVL
jgi:hypothetical protein